MRLRDILIIVVAIVLLVVMLVVAGMRLDYINSQRVEMKLISNEPVENAPPSLAFATVAMGAFRGLVVDVLWIRADRLKEQGQFFDAKQLADWITTLQPRFAKVWEFQAWNMAYNISVAIPAEQPEQRWQWIKNGYELLRDKGIPLNPKSILLYRELGRIFQHKIGGFTDDDQKYYKLQLALAMQPLLGPADNAYFEALAKAPTEWSAVASDPNFEPIISRLKAADKNFLDESRFISNYLSLRQNPARFDPAAMKVIDRFRPTKALADFDVFARAWQLRHVWKLDPQLMLELNRTYGPVDFSDPNLRNPHDRPHPDLHAIYWAVKGLRVAGNVPVNEPGKDRYSVDEENTDRIVAHSLQNLFRAGKIYIYDIPAPPPETGGQVTDVNSAQLPAKDIFLRPDLRMFDSYSKAIIAIIPKYVDPNEFSDDSHEVQMRNMYKNAVFTFYTAGHKQMAQRIYNNLRDLFPNREELASPSVDVFAKQYLKEELENMSITNVTEMVMINLREAYFRYAMRDDDESFAIEKMAEEAYLTYLTKFGEEARLQLPDFKILRYNALIDFFNDEQYPVVLRQNLLARIKIERPQLADQFRQMEEKMLQEAQPSQ
jgi:hypothetical protein